MFEKLINDINFEVTRRLFKVEIEMKTEKKEEESKIYQSASAVDPFTRQQSPTIHPSPTTSHHKIGRNDPCWCGSGKKYKKCHYPN